MKKIEFFGIFFRNFTYPSWQGVIVIGTIIEGEAGIV